MQTNQKKKKYRGIGERNGRECERVRESEVGILRERKRW